MDLPLQNVKDQNHNDLMITNHKYQTFEGVSTNYSKKVTSTLESHNETSLLEFNLVKILEQIFIPRLNPKKPLLREINRNIVRLF